MKFSLRKNPSKSIKDSAVKVYFPLPPGQPIYSINPVSKQFVGYTNCRFNNNRSVSRGGSRRRDILAERAQVCGGRKGIFDAHLQSPCPLNGGGGGDGATVVCARQTKPTHISTRKRTRPRARQHEHTSS